MRRRGRPFLIRRTERKFVPARARPVMRRGTALDIAQRFFSSGQPMPPSTRDDIMATQMAAPTAKTETLFAGWTADEKMAFYQDGTIPKRFRA